MRPIDADVYENEIWKLRRNYQLMDDTHTADKIMHGLYRAEQALKEAPTLDVRPVVHGHWVWDDAKSIYRCSMCKSPKAREDMDRKIIKGQMFCHVCGARMDEKEEEE